MMSQRAVDKAMYSASVVDSNGGLKLRTPNQWTTCKPYNIASAGIASSEANYMLLEENFPKRAYT